MSKAKVFRSLSVDFNLLLVVDDDEEEQGTHDLLLPPSLISSSSSDESLSELRSSVIFLFLPFVFAVTGSSTSSPSADHLAKRLFSKSSNLVDPFFSKGSVESSLTYRELLYFCRLLL